MKKYIFNGLKTIGIIVSFILFVSVVFFISCEEDENDSSTGEAYFNIEGEPTGLSVVAAGKTQAYVVRSNRTWQVVAQSEGDWVRAFPAEGEDDGIFKIIVNENPTFVTRSMNFAFVVEGKEQPVLFRIDQEANVPYITVAESEAGVSIPKVGGDITINVKANVDWSYTLDDDSWLTEQQKTSTQLKLTASRNYGEERQVRLTITSQEFPDVAKDVILTQSPGNIILEEYFSWLAYGSAIFYTTTDEKIIDSWTQAEKDKGWTSTSIFTGTKNEACVYARQGFVKLGKTSYGGDLISPKLSEIVGTVNIEVKFKAVPYMTAAGTKDDNTLNINIIGPGTINTSSFTIDNWPDYTTDPNCTAIWTTSGTERSFTITGATSETQIKFLGGDYNLTGVGKGKNRIFLDDIKVKQIN
jgi:hypothetical protein